MKEMNKIINEFKILYTSNEYGILLYTHTHTQTHGSKAVNPFPSPRKILMPRRDFIKECQSACVCYVW